MERTESPTWANDAARHRQGAGKSIGAIAWTFFWRLRWQYYPMLLSDYGREILRRKYDAFATDTAYEDQPRGVLGPIGRWVDRKVLDFPTHEGVRQRLRIVVDALKADISDRAREGDAPVRVLSAPCGLARDLLTCAAELGRDNPWALQKAEFHALDLDAEGGVLAEASRRSAAQGVPVSFYKDDLFNPKELGALLERGARFDAVNCIGLTAWLDLSDVERLARLLHDRVLAPGGTLVIDNFAWHKYSSIGRDLEIYTRYHAPEAFVAALERSGFRVLERRTTANKVNTVHIAVAV